MNKRMRENLENKKVYEINSNDLNSKTTIVEENTPDDKQSLKIDEQVNTIE
jgi:hypothetical protein